MCPAELDRKQLNHRAGWAAPVVVFASTLGIPVLREHLWLRAALLAVGLSPIAVALFRMVAPTGIDQSNRRRFLFAVLGIHLLATLYAFPPEVLVDRRPIITADYAVHYTQCEGARRVFWHSLRIDSYSPYFMAGYPAGTVFDVDMKGGELFCALSPIPTAQSLKVFFLVAYLALVFSLYRGAKLLGLGTEESALGVLVFLVYWHWGRPYAGDFRYVGMFSFVLASHLSLWLSGILRAFLAGTHRRSFFVLGPLVFLVHISAVVLVMAAFVAIFVCDRKRIHRRQLELMVLWVLVVLLANTLWLKPMIEFLPDKTPTDAYFQINGITDLAHVLLRPMNAMALLLAALAIVGAWKLRSERRGHVAAPLIAASTFLVLCASYGVYVPGLDQTEPGRFFFSSMVFASPLAGVGARSVLAWLQGTVTASNRVPVRAAAIALLAIAPLPLSLIESKAFYRHTVFTTLPTEVEALRVAIVGRVHPGRRLMIEDASATAYGGVYLPSLLPGWTGVEQIGGPYPHTPLRHYATSFTTTRILGTPLANWDPAQLVERLRFLRVRWIVTATRAPSEKIASLPGVSEVWARGPYTLFVLADGDNPEPEVHADYNRLDVSFGHPSDFVVLPYHWVRGIETLPPAEIVPILRYDDPVPYIGVRPHGVSHVMISYGHRPRLL